ncbi:MAG: ABC transporter permease [Pseudomonadota bacterium]
MTRRILAPLFAAICALALWEVLVGALDVKAFILPPPSDIGASLLDGWAALLSAAWHTLKLTWTALSVAIVLSLVLSLVFSASKLVELTFYPYAVVLQVTPIIAIAPLIMIWVGLDNIDLALIIIATLVAFFPLLTTLIQGLRSIDRSLKDLFKLYGANRWQTFIRLQLPATLPAFLSGLKISAGLALIGAVVAEFVAGSGTGQGLAWTMLEASNRLKTDRMFAALIVLSGMGVAQYYLLAWLEDKLTGHWVGR